MSTTARTQTLADASHPTVCALEPEHRPAFWSLWARYFGDVAAEGFERRWHWQFEANPFTRERPSRHFVLASEREVYGYIGAFPIPLRLRGERVIALCATGLVVDEAQRMHAARLMRALAREAPVVGTAMSEGAQKLFCHAGGQVVPLSRTRFMFPLRYNGTMCVRIRQRAPRSLARALQPWMLGRLGGVLRPRGAPAPRRLPPAVDAQGIERFTVFAEEYDELWSRVREQFTCSLDKTAEYMRWRYGGGHAQPPLAFALRDGRGRLSALALAVLRTERDALGHPCATHGELVELMALDQTDPRMHPLLLRLLHELDARRVDSVTASGLTERYHRLLLSLGFEPHGFEILDFALNLGGPDKTRQVVDPASVWYLTAGDGEALFAYEL